jgi:uncharacterized HAD superfamily protein
MKKLRICFDIDGVIATGTVDDVYSDKAGWAFEKCTPINETVELIKELKDAGCEIFLNTARYEEDREVTEKWLEKHDIPYDALFLGKPHADLYVDDKNYPRAFCPQDLAQASAVLEEAAQHAGKRFD